MMRAYRYIIGITASFLLLCFITKPDRIKDSVLFTESNTNRTECVDLNLYQVLGIVCGQIVISGVEYTIKPEAQEISLSDIFSYNPKVQQQYTDLYLLEKGNNEEISIGYIVISSSLDIIAIVIHESHDEERLEYISALSQIKIS